MWLLRMLILKHILKVILAKVVILFNLSLIIFILRLYFESSSAYFHCRLFALYLRLIKSKSNVWSHVSLSFLVNISTPKSSKIENETFSNFSQNFRSYSWKPLLNIDLIAFEILKGSVSETRTHFFNNLLAIQVVKWVFPFPFASKR